MTTKTLSPREIQIMRLVADGLSNKAIGAQLYLSPNTIKTHMQRITKRIGANGRAHAVAICLRSNYLTAA